MSDKTDNLTLLRLIAAGNQCAFQRLFMTYHPKLIYFLVGLTHDEELSKDIAQELFLSLWNNRTKLLSIDSISSYLFVSAKYRVYDYFDKLNVRSRYQMEELLSTADIDSPEEELFAQDIKNLISKIVDTMPSRQKWVDLLGVEEDRTRGDKNITLIRYADVLLMHAEALLETNKELDEVVSILNQIRSRAGLPENIVLTDQDTLRKQLRKERRIETAFEGLRFFDIIRWKIGEEVQERDVYGFAMKDPDTGVRENIFMEKRIWKNNMYLWPIPQAAIDVNENLTQNPEW